MGFKRLAKGHGVRGASVRFVLDLNVLGEQPPSLMVRYAGSGNDGYENAFFKMRQSFGPGQESAQRNRMLREQMIPIYSAHVITGWDSVFDDDMRPAEFSPALVEELLLCVLHGDPSAGVDPNPDEIDRLLGFCREQTNFRAPLPNAEDVGKG